MTRLRLYFLSGCFFALFSFILLRAFQLQFLPHEKIEKIARSQFSQKISIAGRRGGILDRQGRVLALSVNSKSLFANPKQIKSPVRTARVLAKVLGLSEKYLYQRMKDSGERRFVWLARQLNGYQLRRLEKIDLKNLPGIGVVQEYRREYPRGTLASHSLGFVSLDGKGLEGIENKLNAKLEGEGGELVFKKDAKGRPLFLATGKSETQLRVGEEITLTLDATLQHSAERALKKAVSAHNARGGVVAVMNPHTGEILALAVSPGYDPNDASRVAPDTRRHRAVTDPIEPGSVVKPLVVAKAIEDKIVTEKTMVSGGQGFLKVGRKVIGEADAKHRLSQMTIADLIRVSSNVGTVVLQQKMGFERVQDIFQNLGFNRATGIEVPGESRGIFPQLSKGQILEQATMSFGQGFAVTPLQILTAYAPLANGGFKVKAHMVMQDKLPPLERVFSDSTVKTMQKLLERVVQEEGTGVQARVEGFKVAGKTGTSQKVDYQNGGYKSGAYWASFIGFIPSDKARFLIYAMVDEPTGIQYYGGQIAAPIFAEVARDALRLIQTKSPVMAQRKATEVSPQQKKVETNSLVDLPLIHVLKKLEDQKALVEVTNVGTIVDSVEYVSTSTENKIRLRLR